MANGDAVSDEDEVTRWIRRKLLGRDDDDNVILDELSRPAFVFPAAFELGDEEDSLSVTWLQHFGEHRKQHLPAAAEAVRRTMKSGRLPAQSAFAIARVGPVKATGSDHDLKLRVLEDPVEGNTGHTEIRRYPREMSAFQAVLAAETFAERHLYDYLRQPGWTP
jgi:hypothetical protein